MKPNPEIETNALGAREKLGLIRSLQSSQAFALYCERFSEIVAREIDAKIFETETTDEQCRILREARKLLSGAYTPEKQLGSMAAALESEVIRHDRR